MVSRLLCKEVKTTDACSSRCFGKGYDETCPIGPAIIRRGEIDPDNLQLRGELSGELVRESNTKCVSPRQSRTSEVNISLCSDMIFSCRKAISFLSQGKTLEKGSIILMGTLSGIGWMRNPKRTIKDGEEMKIWFEVMDTLINQFKYI